jgi:hypothetical protein
MEAEVAVAEAGDEDGAEAAAGCVTAGTSLSSRRPSPPPSACPCGTSSSSAEKTPDNCMASNATRCTD